MAGITYTGPVDIRGVAADPVITELLFDNHTIKDKLVSFEPGIKAGSIFTENENSVTMQAWSANPTGNEAGSLGFADVMISPVAVEYYDKFTPRDLITTRFNRDMKQGAWNDVSNEFGKLVLTGVQASINKDVETKFWNGALSATKTAVAALTAGVANTSVGTEEKALVAAMPTTLFDSVTTRLIYNNGGVGKRKKVVGTTITSSNIATEYGKLYADIPNETLFASFESPYIYAPRSHRKLINALNLAQTYRDTFTVDIANDKYYYLGIEIKFVPLPENVLICTLPSYIKWCTDSFSDYNLINIEKYPAPAKNYFYDVVFTIFAHVVNQKFTTLYVG